MNGARAVLSLCLTQGLGILLALASMVDASAASTTERSQGAREAPPAAPAADLDRERGWIEECAAALAAEDYAGAREKAAAAVASLMARPEAEQDSEWLSLLNRAGMSAWRAQDVATANAALERVLEVRSRTLSEDDRDLQRARGNVAVTLHALGKFEEARALNERVLEVFARTLPEDHADLQVARLNVAASRSALGDLYGARTLEERVLTVRLRTLSEEHLEVQKARANLALTLGRLGDHEGARALNERVLEVSSRALPNDHVDLQRARGNLAITLHALGELAGARALQEKIVEVFSRTLPDDHRDLQMARQDLAGTMLLLGEPESASALFEKVLEVYSFALPDDHPDVLRVRQNLAATRSVLGDLEGARELYAGVLAARVRNLPSEHPDLQIARGDLAVTLARLAASERDDAKRESFRRQCTELILERSRAQTDAARMELLSNAPREAQSLCEARSAGLDLSLSFAAGCGVFGPSRELDEASFELSETTRGAALSSAASMRAAARSPAYADLRERLRRESDELAALVQSGTTSGMFQATLTRREMTQRQLLELALELSDASVAGAEFSVGALSARLDPGVAAVAFRRYMRAGFEGGTESGTPSLCALVVRRDARASEPSAPQPAGVTRVELGALAPIDAAVRTWREANGATAGSRGVSAVSNPAAGDLAARGVALRRLVFDPLLPALKESSRILIALDDVLHLVPFDALILDDGDELVGDRWRIETRCTLTELLAPSPLPSEDGALVALGDPSFSAAPLTFDAPESERLDEPTSHPLEIAAILRGGAWDQGFAPLPYTAIEARGLGALHDDAFGADARQSIVLEERRASRASLEALASKARFLHVATHGWFAPESVLSWEDDAPLDAKSAVARRASGEDRVNGMAPMLLCGLALAGANRSRAAHGSSGLITADEISTLDLSSCELAVLSACDTNVGIQRSGQGVASLQKALQMAGARSVITSLWKVPDEATKELMLDFYRRLWVEKKPKWQALWEAKKKLRDAKDERGAPRYTTRDWAAWVLTGNPD